MDDDLREIAGFPRYFINRRGEVFARIAWKRSPNFPLKKLSPYATKGYPRVQLWRDGRATMIAVHRLLAAAFLKREPHHQCVRHINGDRSDNRISNLAWGTYAENSADMVRHGTVSRHGKAGPRIRGENNGRARLTLAQVAIIRAELARGATQKSLARTFNVASSTICHIATGRIWKSTP